MALHGYDLNHYKPGLNLSKLDSDFFIMKATEGTGFVDSSCDGYYQQAKKLGKPRGVYHFYRGSPTQEADFFLNQVAGYVGDGILALDFEAKEVIGDLTGAKAFCDRVFAKTGVRPLLYMSQSVANQSGWASAARDYGLWVARYNESIGPTGPWDQVVLWQYSSTEHALGVDLDANWFYGSVATWEAYATGEDIDDGGGDDGGGGDDVAMRWKNTQYGTDKPVKADGSWRVLTIGEGDDGGILYSYLTGPVGCSGVLNVSITGLPKGHEAALRPIFVETKSGQDTRVVQEFPSVQKTSNGGTTQMALPFAQDIISGTDGWARRLRFQIRVHGGEEVDTVQVISARVRGHHWDR